MRSQRPTSHMSDVNAVLVAFRHWANGLRPAYSSPHASQLTENDISERWKVTPSSAKSRVSNG